MRSTVFPPKDRHHILNRNHEQAIVALEIHGDGVLGVEEHPVVLLDRIVLVAFNLGAHGHHAAGEGRDLNLVGQVQTVLGDLLVLVLADQDPLAQRLDHFDGVLALATFARVGHGAIITAVDGADTARLRYLSPMHAQLTSLIRDVPDFPKKGIVFKDVTPLLASPAGLALAIELMANPFRNERIDVVVGPESRGFIFGTAVATALSAGFVPVRKPGKLPYQTRFMEYALEYGTDQLHVHVDAVKPGMRVLLVDDLLATGGTLAASMKLLGPDGLGGNIIGASVLIELEFLKGRAQLGGLRTESILRY
ncbi:MAG: Adenine phosphoribosyltransferase [Planctomycetota bacterium]